MTFCRPAKSTSVTMLPSEFSSVKEGAFSPTLSISGSFIAGRLFTRRIRARVNNRLNKTTTHRRIELIAKACCMFYFLSTEDSNNFLNVGQDQYKNEGRQSGQAS